MPPKNSSAAAILSLITVLALIISPLAIASTSSTSTQSSTVQLTATQEYLNYVHNFVGAQGNCTYVEKPMFPVLINNNQIPIGQNWTIICPLQKGHNYHIYFYGSYINTSSVAKCDYNVYVYDPDGALESTHTQSAGLPEHLGTNVTVPLFTPTQTGNYTFVITNNPVDSYSAQEATFMIIENLQTDVWYTTPIEGTNDGSTSFYTNWAYEFETNASKVALYINVPDTLDMYEARLYLMNNAQSPTLDNFPLPWEPGLYGNLSGSVGGYNFEPNSYRGVAYASCEYMGEPMFLNYTSPNKGANLYQVVLMGEVGSGNLTFMLKSSFLNSTLTPVTVPKKVFPDEAAQVAFTSNNTDLSSAQLSYTTDDWNRSYAVSMQVSNQTCSGSIPGQKAGSFVQYRVNATDVMENMWLASGNYTVKGNATLDIAVAKNKILLGQSIKVTGTLTPNFNNSIVNIQFADANSVKILNCTVSGNGTFTATWKPTASGLWSVIANTNMTQTSFAAYSQQVMVTVTPPPLYIRYSLYLIVGFVALMALCGVAYFLSSRRS
ncbi:MAG: hypothetical protein ABSG33_07320 [Candidatus Bathyarchaeia archaeon]|jgi:hypothetical protein